MIQTTRTLALAAALLSGAVSAHATLHDRGGGMIYDDELDITWLQNWNQAGTAMDWNTAVAWADTLVHGGYSDWRLPTMIDTSDPGCNRSNAGGTDCGYNVQTKSGSTVYSEMAHLWYVTLGNKGYCDPATSTWDTCVQQPGWGLTNTGPFTNMQSNAYWSGLEYAPHPLNAWYFVTSHGEQYFFYKFLALSAVAVRPGDVAAIPEPPTVVLMMLGIGAALLKRRGRPL